MNLDRYCNTLDAYLSDDLSDNQRAIFELHLEGCPTCRDAVNQQQWIDGLLQSSARIQLETPSGTIVDCFRVSVAQRRRRVMKVACGLAVAATLLIAIGFLELKRQAIGRVDHEASRSDVADDLRTQVAAPLRATFVGGAEVIAVPVESHHPDVTIVRIYPTYQPNYATQVGVDDTTTEFIRPDYPTEVNNGT